MANSESSSSNVSTAISLSSQETRILHVCPRHSFSGLESWVLEMIKHQKTKGLRVALLVLEGSPMHEQAKALGIELFTARSPLGFLSLIRAVKSATRAFEPHVLHMHNSQDFKTIAFWLAVTPRKFKTVLQLHIWLSHPKRDPLHAWLYTKLDELWCSSSPARASVIKFVPINPKKVRIVHYGRPVASMMANLLSREEARCELKLPSDAVVVGTVSRIDKGKGSEELVRGTAKLMETNPKLHLVIVGTPTADPEAEQFAARLKALSDAWPESLRSRLHWTGGLKDSFRYLQAFDIFALPSYRECFSLALLEAQLAALPCLVTNAGGSPELVREGETGWLCEPESVDSLQAALARALSAQSSWQDFGNRARSRILQEFDSNVVLGELIDGYRRLLGR